MAVVEEEIDGIFGNGKGNCGLRSSLLYGLISWVSMYGSKKTPTNGSPYPSEILIRRYASHQYRASFSSHTLLLNMKVCQ